MYRARRDNARKNIGYDKKRGERMVTKDITLLQEQIIELKHRLIRLELGFRHQDEIIQQYLINRHRTENLPNWIKNGGYNE